MSFEANFPEWSINNRFSDIFFIYLYISSTNKQINWYEMGQQESNNYNKQPGLVWNTIVTIKKEATRRDNAMTDFKLK